MTPETTFREQCEEWRQAGLIHNYSLRDNGQTTMGVIYLRDNTRFMHVIYKNEKYAQNMDTALTALHVKIIEHGNE